MPPGVQNVVTRSVVTCYDEMTDYDFSRPEIRKGDRLTEHFTQLVWKVRGEGRQQRQKTKHIGMGITCYKTGPFKGCCLMVTKYKPRGNGQGKAAWRVLKECSG